MSTLQHNAFDELERGMMAALETYSNVHRGTGHYSIISTELFERAREIIIEYLGLDKKKYVVVFCTPYGSEILKAQLKSGDYHELSSGDVGLPLGLRVLAIRKRDLPKGIPFHTGGNVAKMVSPNTVLWAASPLKFEAGTPSVMIAVALAKALLLKKQYGEDCFRPAADEKPSAFDILNNDELSAYSGLQLAEKMRKLLVGHDVLVPTAEGEKPYINFDNAASTPAFLPVWNVVSKVLRQSEEVHGDIISEVKKIIARFLSADPEKYNTVFTCNATEAINIAARFVKEEFSGDNNLVILNTLLEHNSNELPWRYIQGATMIRLSVDKEGFVSIEEMERILKEYNSESIHGEKRIRIVAVSGASNVLGTYNDIEAISIVAHKYGARILVDGAQLVAHRSVNIDKWDIDYFAFSGHKIYAPFGSGVLLVRKKYLNATYADLARIADSGEENVVGIAALGKAMLLLQRIGMDVIEGSERALVHRLLEGLPRIPGLTVFGIKDPDSDRLQNKGGIVPFALKDGAHARAAKELAEQGGVGVRFGCFCSHMLIKHLVNVPTSLTFLQDTVLTLIPGLKFPGLMRVSFGLENDLSEVDRFLSVLKRVNNKKQPSASGTVYISSADVRKKMNEFLETRMQMVF